MKKVLKVMVLMIMLINLLLTISFAEELKNLKDSLEMLGVSEEYSKNIMNYIENLNITEDQLNDIIKDSLDIYNDFNEKSKDGIDVLESLSVYSDVKKVAENLNIDIGIDIVNREVELKNNNTNEVLLKFNKEDASEYYNNFKKINIDKGQYYELLDLAKEAILVKEFHDDTSYHNNESSDNISSDEDITRTKNQHKDYSKELSRNESEEELKDSDLEEVKENDLIVDNDDLKESNDNLSSKSSESNINKGRDSWIYGIVFIVIIIYVILYIIKGLIN